MTALNGNKTTRLTMNLKLLRLSFLAFLLPMFHTGNAQCEYTLNMFDSFGDGWNGGTLNITSGTATYSFTLAGFPLDNGSDSTVTFIVANGQPLVLSWMPGFFNPEVSFSILDYDGDLVFQTSNPSTGTVFSGTGSCPSCLRPIDVETENVFDTYARVRWTPVSLVQPLGWWVIYGPQGFSLSAGEGDSLYVTTPKATITGLTPKTNYDWYLLEMCDSTDFAKLAGPISFQTYWSNDVGISAVITPESGCSLGVETVKIVMSNFGAKPQSLIPFRYSVNGKDAGVPQPQDGYYTGVLGKDSSAVIEFETTYDFSEPGEYLILVYTQMSNDEDRSNDTFRYYIVNRLLAPYNQHFETWSGGWFVDTENSANPSWEYGNPSATFISAAASGQNAWVTNLDGDYNTEETSYLQSPCFDFSNLTIDPVIQFSIIYRNFSTFDGAWLEMSINDGDTWEKVGALDEGFNWYTDFNTSNDLGDVWSGTNDGWETARIQLLGVAGESNVRFRFAFSSYFSFSTAEGVGVDDIRIYVPFEKDLFGVSVKSAGDGNDCGLQNDQITFSFTNFGTAPQTGIQVAYSLNGGTPVVETINETVLPYELFTYTFNTPFDSRDASFDIKCWTNLAGEQDFTNDTAYYSVSHLPKAVPFKEDFEGLAIPEGWLVSGGGSITNANNNTSYVLSSNLWFNNPEFTYDLPRYGLISMGDSLTFEYKITNFGSGGTAATVLTGGSKIEVQVSTNCSTYQTIYTINNITHTPTILMRTIRLNLSGFAGQAVKIRFKGTWGAGDFNFDLDNINLRACATDMQLSATVTPSTNGQNGAATVNVGLGNPPYNYLWSNGATTQTVTGLPVGPISVTVTDARGCTGELTINIGTTSTHDIDGLQALTLRPNPTSGLAWLNVSFDRPMDLNVEITDLLGRRIWEANASYTTQFAEQLDVANFPNGLYIIRLTASGQTTTRKLVKSN